ncbi:MAG TPA: hypothetical protein GX707_15155 [Epulopiscium sp.]|nr:hypothetical protein [Candidatus Epulonipiscium sp.]
MQINKTEAVNSVRTSTEYAKQMQPETQTKQTSEVVQPETPAATLELSDKKTEEVTYKKPGDTKIDRNEINKLIEESDKKMENFKNLIRTLIEKQGGTVETALSGEFLVKIDETTRLQAQEAISEDGEFGVAKTAERLVNFAKAISGGDVTKLDTLKKAIKQGFDEAEAILGELPEISKETYKEVMRQLDLWASGGEKIEE